jgi:hypothetical protein
MHGFSKEWKTIEQQFPETKFFYYNDPKAKVTDLIVNCNYTPIHRLTSLEKHFKEFPRLSDASIFYLDSDVLFTKYPKFEKTALEDNTNYLSDTHTYLNEEYLQSKLKDVKEEKREEYIKADVIGRAASFAKLTVNTLKENNNNCGGAQYILKNMTPEFFSECIDICLKVRMFFQAINQEFFPGTTAQEREDKGIQSFCADMWAIQWNLYRHNLPSQTPKWMDFAWATDEIGRIENVLMMHNAGISNSASIRITKNLKSVKGEDGKSVVVDCPAFFKDKYRTINVFDCMEDVQRVVDNLDSQKYCTSYYAKEVLETYNNLIKTKT